MNTEKYNMSFIGGGLLQQESVKLAELYLEKTDWGEVRKEAINKNLLQARTSSSAKRICPEICKRLSCLNQKELELLVTGDPREQAYLIWLAICRKYRLLYEFSVEVIRERFLSLNNHLSYEDFDAFFNAKAEWHEELEKITASTRYKVRQILFKMLREAGLWSTDKLIIPAMLSPRLINVICSHAHQDLHIFPIMETTIQGCAT